MANVKSAAPVMPSAPPVALSDSALQLAEPWPSPGRAWYAVFVLSLGLMVTYLDRGILSLLVEPIKRDLHISDTQMSLLMGFAFVCFYLIVALPIARLVDYKSRRAILGTGTAIWSLTTAVSGLARTFGQLFFCRVGAGVGAACSSPASFSMLADLFPRDKLPRAFAVLFFGMFLGEGTALIVGGTLANAFGRISPISWPLVGPLHGWQLTLIVIGLPGLLIAGLMATVCEPARRGRIVVAGDSEILPQQLPIREVLGFIRTNAGIFIPMFASMGIAAVMGFGIRSWAPSFYVRTFHWTIGKYGLVQGLLSLFVMPIGALTGSFFAEQLAKRGYDDANMRTVFVGQLLSLPGMILFPLMPTPGLSIALCTAYTFFVYWTNAPMNAALQIVTPNQMRGQVTASVRLQRHRFWDGTHNHCVIHGFRVSLREDGRVFDGCCYIDSGFAYGRNYVDRNQALWPCDRAAKGSRELQHSSQRACGRIVIAPTPHSVIARMEETL